MTAGVFPAHAGMSPLMGKPAILAISFPRTRGDEPLRYDWKELREWFSPHTRG